MFWALLPYRDVTWASWDLKYLHVCPKPCSDQDQMVCQSFLITGSQRGESISALNHKGSVMQALPYHDVIMRPFGEDTYIRSPSSNVSGNGRPVVSGRKNVDIPAKDEREPNTAGGIYVLCIDCKISYNDFLWIVLNTKWNAHCWNMQ